MKTILPILIVLLLTSCLQSKDEKTNSDLYKTVSLKFAKILVQVPANYVRSSFDEYEKKLIESDRDEFLKGLDLQSLNGLRSLPVAIEIYADSTNFLNYILFQDGEHVMLTKPIAQQYLQVLKGHLERSWGSLGLSYDLKEKKFFSNGNSQVIKIKYKTAIRDYKKYQTQYIVSGRTKTIGVIVSTVQDIDSDDIVGRIKM